MKKLIVLIAFAFAALAPLNAQDFRARLPEGDARPQREADPQERIDRRVTHLTEALSLSPEQTTEVRSILTSNQEKMMALRESTTDRRELRQQMMQSLRETDTQIEALLDDGQKAKYAEIKQKERRRRGGRSGGRPQRGGGF